FCEPQRADLVPDLTESSDQLITIARCRGLAGVADTTDKLAAQGGVEGNNPNRHIHVLGRIADHLEALLMPGKLARARTTPGRTHVVLLDAIRRIDVAVGGVRAVSHENQVPVARHAIVFFASVREHTAG